jgi:streptomycin 6-kinase
MALVQVDKSILKKYLAEVFQGDVTNVKINKLGKGVLGAGYALDFTLNGQTQRKVLKTLFQQHLGQDYFADRAQSLILAHDDYPKMDQHVKSFDVCGVSDKGGIVSLGQAKEFFILMDEAHGQDYFTDLIRLAKTNRWRLQDQKKAVILADFLAKLHHQKITSPSLYQRKIRDTIGSGQSLMGVFDSYPPQAKQPDQNQLKQIVQAAVSFWVKDRLKKDRLCQIHGDFHPGNIWWQDEKRFIVLDRARGAYGEAADDVAALTINYLFYSLRHQSKYQGVLKKLQALFWQRYLQKSQDRQIAEVIPPYFAFRVAVLCHPLFYPDRFYGSPGQAKMIRQKLLNFSLNVLDEKEFSWSKIDQYLS